MPLNDGDCILLLIFCSRLILSYITLSKERRRYRGGKEEKEIVQFIQD